MSFCKHVGHSSLLVISQNLDHVEWMIQDACSSGTIDQDFIAGLTLDRDTCSIFFKFFPASVYTAPGDEDYIRSKFYRLNEKIALLPVMLASSNEDTAETETLPSKTEPPASLLPDPCFVVQQEILSSSRQLDQIQWALEDQLRDHPVSTETLAETNEKLRQCFTKYLIDVLPKIQLGADQNLTQANLHFLEKYQYLLKNRQIELIEPTLDHRQYADRSQRPVEVVSPPVPESFAEDELLSVRLNKVACVLCHGSDTEVLQALNRLSSPLQQSFIDSLWVVRGRPILTECMGHKNFGEILFTSSPQQKGCAIELVKLSLMFSDLISILNKNDLVQLRNYFENLPVHIQNEIFGKHWEQMGSPTSKSPKEFLRKMAHDDFGRVSFLGTESRCDVFPYLKVKTLEAYLIDFNQKIATAQALTEQIKGEWNQLDLNEEEYIEKKVSTKKKNLQYLAGAIVPLFEGKEPKPLMTKLCESYHALGKAYVETYPCLKPFFLQLMNNL